MPWVRRARKGALPPSPLPTPLWKEILTRLVSMQVGGLLAHVTLYQPRSHQEDSTADIFMQGDSLKGTGSTGDSEVTLRLKAQREGVEQEL